MTAAQLVPGIQRYPDLEAALAARIPRDCGKCGMGKLIDEYRRRVNARLERDKWLKSP